MRLLQRCDIFSEPDTDFICSLNFSIHILLSGQEKIVKNYRLSLLADQSFHLRAWQKISKIKMTKNSSMLVVWFAGL